MGSRNLRGMFARHRRASPVPNSRPHRDLYLTGACAARFTLDLSSDSQRPHFVESVDMDLRKSRIKKPGYSAFLIER